ncbi:MAG TPA: hypothetical protein DCG83_06360 [Cryomorphaceae bacterium]|nr:hypothetical protein [Cryomorphaceae bacterium]
MVKVTMPAMIAITNAIWPYSCVFDICALFPPPNELFVGIWNQFSSYGIYLFFFVIQNRTSL